MGEGMVGLKKTTADLFAASVGRVSRLRGGMRVLTFHNIGDTSDGPLALTRYQFEDFLRVLKGEGYRTILASEFVARQPAVAQDERVVALTFDDGFASHSDTVAEMLAPHGMTATFFIVSSLLGSERVHTTFSGRQHAFVSVSDIRELESAGFEIGSHSHTHALCGTLPPDQIRYELQFSKHTLEQELGHPIKSFAYPFGRKGAFSGLTRDVLASSGYLVAFTQEGLHIGRETDLLRVPRTSIDQLDTARTFARKLHGQYELFSRIRNYAELT